MMAGYRRAAQSAMADRIQRGIDEGDLPKDTNVETLAAFFSALSRGMVVLARDGASRERLLEIVDLGMRAWPSAPSKRARPSGQPPRARSSGTRARVPTKQGPRRA
jgi:hypothetical protein